VNPGCFRSFDPPSDGDCTSHTDQFMLQVILPNLETEHRVTELHFWSNDGSTIFPAAGVLVSSRNENDEIPLPTPQQLSALQGRNVSSTRDTSRVRVDLETAALIVPAGPEVVLFAAVQFPATGILTQIGAGPGILVDATLPDQDCDFFTVDGGNTWRAPLYVPGDPLSEPLDWGFEVHLEPTTSLEAVTWSNLKRLYRRP
jgi:hypothetical protein